ncbi:MAG: carbohydrate kinase family protein [Planctomycetaceae bacterium]|nr:carbohydrate kinase family protein [Planctomycetaceae bacterium]
MTQSLDCLCAGIVVADHVCEPIERLPHSGELVLTNGTTITIGGCAANVSVDLAKLGCRVKFSGVVGSDALGDFSIKFLQNAKVETDLLTVSNEKPTSASLIIPVRGDDRRFIHSTGANDLFSAADIDREILKNCRVLYLGGYCITDTWPVDDIVQLFKDAQSGGTLTVLDVVIPKAGEFWERIAPVLRYTDAFLPNNDEGEAITGIADPLEQARRFRSAGAKEVVITCGDDGLVALNEETIQAGRFEVNFVDGTGSGDAFSAGFILGMLEQRPMKDRLAMGSALGASCVQALGATTGVFNGEQLLQFLAENQLHYSQA